MNSEKYIFNPQTLQYEKAKVPLKKRIISLIGFVSSVIIVAAIALTINYIYFPSAKEKALMRELSQMEQQYDYISSDFEKISSSLEDLQRKDSEIHRVILGKEPIDKGQWEGGTGGHDKYLHLTKYQKTGDLLVSTLGKVDKLKRKLDIQKNSLDSLYSIAIEREDKMLSIPSIKPVQEDKLKRKIKHLSGFGMRMHPVFKVRRMHKGMDFTAPKGTNIQATGNGKVIKLKKSRTGFGHHIVIDHGYGYQTTYAHMSKFSVKKGQKVVKGQKIGEIGSTGTSTAPHLHYEVHLHGKAVNPIDYCLDGLTPEEYMEMLEKSKEENQSLD